MIYEISLAQSLVLNFFNGDIYFIFENKEEKQSFLNFIQIYDEHLQNGFDRIDEMKSVKWSFSKITQKHQIEYNKDEKPAEFKDALPVSYSLVREYADQFTGAYNFIVALFNLKV